MFRLLVLSVLPLFLLSACASSTFKARQEQREKLAASTGMYCEFVSGDIHPDLDVELSMQMARRCDSNRPFSITNYKNSSDQIGVVYCCAVPTSRVAASATRQSRAQHATPAAAKESAPAKDAAPASSTQEIEDAILPQ